MKTPFTSEEDAFMKEEAKKDWSEKQKNQFKSVVARENNEKQIDLEIHL